jgi:hypothetical protein
MSRFIISLLLSPLIILIALGGVCWILVGRSMELMLEAESDDARLGGEE